MELVQKRLQILVKMKETYIEQARSMEDSDALLGTIARKQYLLDQLLAVHDEIAPFQEAGPESRNWSSESEQRQRVNVSQTKGRRSWSNSIDGAVRYRVIAATASGDAI